MTKQDAIEYLLYMKHDVQAKSPMDIALDTAIEALKQPTIKPEVRRGRWIYNGYDEYPTCSYMITEGTDMNEIRLIDANALVKEMCNNGMENNCPCYPKCYPCDFREARMLIDEQPTIDVNPLRNAEWISEIVTWIDWEGQKRKRFQPISCSNCHSPSADRTNYCSCCGAKMDAEDINVLANDGGAENG